MTDLLLPNASVTYYENFVSKDIGKKIFDLVENQMLSEEIKRVNLNDSSYKLKRKTLVFVDNTISNLVIPKIWGLNVTVLKFTPEILELKTAVEETTNYNFNICLVNYYSTGKNNIGWHSDNEEKGDIECIASISLGASREFAFRIKGQKDILHKLQLNDCDLLVMDSGCQENYEHCLMPNKLITESRVNLTFRKFKFEQYNL